MKKLHNLLVILPFFLILSWYAYQSIILPDQEISDVENRELMQMPELSEDEEITSGAIQKYTGEITEYVVDQFPNRDEFLKFYSQLEMEQKKIFLRNVYLADSEWMMTHIYEVPNEQWGWLTSVIRQAKEKVDIPFVYAVLPQKNDLLHQIENGLIDNNNSIKNKAQLLEHLAALEDVNTIDVSEYMLNSFDLEERKDFYFKTDFHWNPYGAFQAARYISKTMVEEGLLETDAALEDFWWKDYSERYLFQGDLNRRFSNLFSMEEDIRYYEYDTPEDLSYYVMLGATQSVPRETVVGSGLVDPEATEIDYNNLTTMNRGYYRIINENPKVDQCILILKDSLQNPTTDYFSSIYREVNVVDPRYYKEPRDFYGLLEYRDVDLVLMMFHQNNCST
ncbi:MAG: hypothetical protein J6S45_02630, partial [Firmicutes bacterium]|nr:hypothetical protein [Bacillota bacterium]